MVVAGFVISPATLSTSLRPALTAGASPAAVAAIEHRWFRAAALKGLGFKGKLALNVGGRKRGRGDTEEAPKEVVLNRRLISMINSVGFATCRDEWTETPQGYASLPASPLPPPSLVRC